MEIEPIVHRVREEFGEVPGEMAPAQASRLRV
jgi:hypothetical protein